MRITMPRQTKAWSRRCRRGSLCASFVVAISALLPITTQCGAAEEPPRRLAAARPLEAGHSVATDNSVRGVVRSFETASITAELNARIERLPVREGDRIKKGDVLVEFDCTRVRAERDAAAAHARAQRIVHTNQVKLLQYKAAGRLAVKQSAAELDKAEAEVRSHNAKVGTCRILAPFGARVAEKLVQAHEIAQPNQPLVKLVNEERLELVLMVPSSWLASLTSQGALRLRMDETGTMHSARILQSAGVIDPVSQSARVIAEIVDPPASIVPGMSGTIFFDTLGAGR